MIFFNKDGQTDTQTPYKTNHPNTLYGYGQKFFSTSLKTDWASKVSSLSFVWIIPY